MKIKEIWNKQIKQRYIFFVGMVLSIVFFIPSVSIISTHYSMQFDFWIWGCFCGFAGWTICAFAWRKDFKNW